MFLADLDQTEQGAFLSLARNMVAADKKVTIEEEEMLNDLHKEIGETLQIEPIQNNVQEICGLVVDPKSQAHMLLELASIAFVDGDYEVRERELLMQIAENWSIEKLSFLRAEDWGKKRVELAAEAVHIVHEIMI